MDVRYDGNYVDLEERIQDLEMALKASEEKLEAAEHELLKWYAMEWAGVDNWEGYHYGIELLLEDHPDYFGDE